MRDIVLSDEDRKRLVFLLAHLFPDNDSATRLLELVSYPIHRWPGITDDPIIGWQEALRDFDESSPAETPYSELLIGIKRIFPAETELVHLANRYHAETRVILRQPNVLVVSADDEAGASGSRWSRELSVIQQAHRAGYVNVHVCSATMLDPDRAGHFRPEYVHVNGHCDGQSIHFDDGAVPTDRLVDCIDRSITNHRLTIRGMVLDGGHNGQQVFRKFRPVAEYVAVHGAEVTGELGVRFAEKLYQLLQLAPRFESAVHAAHHFVFQQRYGSTGHPGQILNWAAPEGEGHTGNGRVSSIGGIFTSRPDADADIPLSPKDRVAFEDVLVSLYRSDPEKSRSLMRVAGFSFELHSELIRANDVDWNKAFIALEAGRVRPEETPFRNMLEWALRDCPGNAELRRLTAKYLSTGGAGR